MLSIESELTLEEIAKVESYERAIRTYFRMKGELDESNEIITQLKAQILLATAKSYVARYFFTLLERDSKKIDFMEVYLAGKRSRAQGESFTDGLNNFLVEFSQDPDRSSFEKELQQTYSDLYDLLHGDEPTIYPKYLLEEYRKTYCEVNNHVEDFFTLGYRAGLTHESNE